MNTTTPPPPVGNAEAMREALVKARDALSSAAKYVYGNPPNGGSLGWNDVWPAEWHNAIEAVKAALSEPPRNCDRFATWQEAKAAFWREVGDPADWQRLLEWLYAHSHVEYK